MVITMNFFGAIAQSPWKQVSLTSSVAKGKDVFKNHFKPSRYISFQLDEAAMKYQLRNVPNERNVSSSRSSAIMYVPNSKGQIERFRVVEAPSMEPGLAKQFPDIKSYSGQSIDHPGSRIRFDMSPLGFNASIMSADRKTFYISCVDKASKSYIIYDRELLSAKKYDFDCLLDETLNSEVQGSSAKGGITDKNANTNTLRIYRLALNLAGEFSRAILADVAPGTDTSTDVLKKAIVLSLANSITTEANSYFENEMHLRLVLINNETSIIYLDPATDPFSTWTPTFTTTTWNTQTQTNCTNVIGTANYDIGHMLTYNTEKNNGNAGCIGCICKDPAVYGASNGKGRGWNMYGEYQGYYLVVDYWTHEMGHQFGGNHTFTHNDEGSSVQIEPGSGTTIMAYAGITGATDVQMHSDPFFHSKSIEQITDYIQTGIGNTCGTTLALTNNLPTVNAGSDYTVPKSTPFLLTGTSTDGDGSADVPTYNWEQIDDFTTGSNTYPTATSTTGPMFRFFPPVTSLSRSFPRLEVILDSNNTGKWEVLPSVARTMNFRFIVRDNHSGISANVSDDVKITVSGTAGPLAVTSPNTGVSYASGSTQTITWDVNSTNTLSTNVKISMSADGGQTFPYVLAASTANDGTEALALPNIASGACRIKVEAIGNIFFDVSNVNFAVGACGSAVGLKATSITGNSATVSWTAVTGATSYDVDYRVVGAGSWTTGVAATASTSLNLTGLKQGTDYEFRVKTNCSFNNGVFTSETFSTLCSTAPTGLTASAITSSTATLSWTAAAGAASYKVDYKLTTESIWVRAENETTSTSVDISNLIAGKTYDYRVRSNCASSLSYSTYTTAQFTSLCSAVPTGLTATSVTNSSATLGWTASAGASSYTVDYKLSSAGSWTNALNAVNTTTVNVTGLTQGRLYDYRVKINCASGSTAYTSAQFATLCNSAPTGLSASSITNSSATLSWSASAGAVSYDVDYKLTSSGTWTNAVTATASTSVGISSLTTGAQYDYRVRANCSVGSTSYTSAQFTTLCNVAPTGLSASSITNSSATLSWSASAGAVSYDVDYKLTSSGTWTNAATATATTSIDISSLATGVQYDYRVRANCSVGSTSYTSAQFTTLCNVAPTGLSASSVTNSSATLSWSASTGAVSYDVDYKLTSSGTWTNAVTATAATSIDISSLATGAQYDYRVRANCSVGSTSYTSAQFTTLCNVAPTGLSASSITNSSATLSWSASTGAVSYDVDYKLTSSGTWTNAATATASTSVGISGLATGAQYNYRVRANCSVGTTSPTSAQFSTLCNVTPTGLSASSITNSSATLSWSASAGAVSYDVDYKLTSSGTWTNAATATATTSIDISSLATGVQYDYRVRANCSVGSTSYTSAQFSTLCNVAPTGLSASSITNSSATLSWSASAGAVSYDVDYKLTSSGTWTNAATATASTSVGISGLATGAQYNYRVRANCSVGTTSPTSAQFSTLCNIAPSTLSASSITISSASLSWSSAQGAASYDVDYKASSSGIWINIATATTSTSVSLNSLNYNTSYDWRVRTNCSAGSSSYSSDQFTTETPSCDAPSSLTATNLSATGATVSWSSVASAASYDVDYKVSTSSVWINAVSATTSTSAILNGLASVTNFDWRVRTNCIYSNTSDYTVGQQFRTLLAAGCTTPVNLATTNITESSATLNWDASPDAVSYNVGYRAYGSLNWTNAAAATTLTSVNISGLTEETLYEWRVRTNCSSDASAYNTIQFTTLYSNRCPGKFDTVSNNAFATASLVPVNRDIYGMIETAGDVDYYRFTMSAAGFISVNLTNLPKNYNIYLYNGSFVPIDSSLKLGTTNESIYRKVGKGTQYVKVIAINPGTFAPTQCYTLNITPDVASKGGSNAITLSRNKSGIQVYPNPALANINITAKSPANSVIKISDVYGRNIMQVKAQIDNTNINIGKLRSGTYFVTVLSKDGIVLYNTKFIKY
jgi:hypothetical protein